MTESGRKFIKSIQDIREQYGINVRIRGDYLVWPDGRQERITDPRYWVARQEVQDKIGE